MRLILKILKIVFFSILGLLTTILILLLFDRDYGPIDPKYKNAFQEVTQKYEVPKDSTLYYELLDKFGKNKTLPQGHELQALIALSYYPELTEAPIDFIFEETFLPLASRPDPFTILFPWLSRRYLVVISSKSNDFFEPILLKNLPFNEGIGVIGHELAHTVYYQDKSALQLVQIGLSYTQDDFITPFERDTDKRAIAHGLGHQMFDFAIFVRKSLSPDIDSITLYNQRGGTYLSPIEIEEEMQKYPYKEVP